MTIPDKIIWDISMVIGALVSFAGYAAITTPIEGAFARWRAHYNPKVVQLEGSEEADANSKRTTNVFKMLGRVYKVEGATGLYKGIMPNFIATAATMLFFVFTAATHIDYTDVIRYRWHFTNPFAFYLYEVFSRSLRVALLVLPALPFTILYMRVVTTSFILPVHKPRLAIRLLFTPEELRRPWKLYTRALIATHAFPAAWIIEVLSRMHKLLPPLDGSQSHKEYVWWRVVLTILAMIVSFIVLPPLEVIKAKLSVQKIIRSHTILPTEEQEAQLGVAEYSEEVVGFRQEPYKGLFDCFKKIAQEEGLKALFRLWWLNAIVVLLISGIGRWALGIQNY